MSRLLCKYGRRAFNSTSPQVKLVQLHNELHRKQELSLQLRSLKFQPELAEDAQEIFSIDTKFASADGASYPHPHPYAKALQKIREAAAVDEEMYPHPHPYASALQKIREYTELELEYEKSVREEVSHIWLSFGTSL